MVQSLGHSRLTLVTLQVNEKIVFPAAVAGGAIIALLLINFAFGVMTRAAPQLNIFSIGFAVSMMSGLFILWLTIGGFMGHFDALWERVQETSCELIQVQCLGGQNG